MAGQRKPYNPNTAYGRKKLREQADETYARLSPGEKVEVDSWKFGCIFAIIALAIIIGLLTGNVSGALKWLSH